MKCSALTVLLPCHSLEDFPVYYEGQEADELLAAWCVLWHPALLAAAGTLPNWHRVDVPPESLAGHVVTVPPFCADRLPAGLLARATSDGGWPVRESTRDAALATALAGLDNPPGDLDESLAADFLALGFCRLQIELLTRAMRYSVNIDDVHFQNETIAAAQAAVRRDEETARAHLATCFETLCEARKRFYPADFYFTDLTLVTANQAAELARELERPTPTNLVAPLAVWQTLKAEHPGQWARVLAAIDQATACIVGGEVQERALPLLPPETALAALAGGACAYEALLGRRPQVYARRRAGLWPGLPQLLVKLGYQGALHFTLDDGRFPLSAQSKSRWEGLDSSTIDILGQVPSDAAKPSTFLGLSRKMADSMDNDHVATLVLAHWPGAASPWYDDLRRIAAQSPVLGQFMLLDDYFSHTDMPGRLSKFDADEYRTPYLKQTIARRQSDASSAFVREHRRQAHDAAVQAIATLRDLARGKRCADADAARQPEASSTADAEANDLLASATERLAKALPRGDGPAGPRRIVVNPLSITRQIGIEWPSGEALPAIKGPVVSTGTSGDRSFAVVEVPAMGFAWLASAAESQAPSKVKPIARDNVLANEFVEVTVNRKTGGIGSVYSAQHRGNQVSQQIAFRMPGGPPEPGAAWRDPDDDATYSTMQAESVEVTASCAAYGEITSRGVLLDGGGRRLSGFRQTTKLWAGSRVVRVEIELTEPDEPRADPWNSYYAARFAWPDETAQLVRGVGLAREQTGARRLESPEFLDIEGPNGHVTILTGGLPYHRRTADRMLDTLLVVRSERARKFELGIGVDLTHPPAAALEFIAPSAQCADSGPPPTAASGWFFHVDAKNVVATHWEPLVDELPDSDEPAQAERPATLPIRGFRARLIETAGRAGRVSLRAYRPLAAARQVDFQGQTLVEATVDDDRVRLDFAAYEWIEVEALFSA